MLVMEAMLRWQWQSFSKWVQQKGEREDIIGARGMRQPKQQNQELRTVLKR